MTHQGAEVELCWSTAQVTDVTSNAKLCWPSLLKVCQVFERFKVAVESSRFYLLEHSRDIHPEEGDHASSPSVSERSGMNHTG